jgi:hypothetical protein
MNRREFLHTTIGVAAVSALRPADARQAGVIGANERVRMGLIGCGTRGNQVMSAFGKAPNNVFVAACDVSKDRLDQTVAKMASAGDPAVRRRRQSGAGSRRARAGRPQLGDVPRTRWGPSPFVRGEVSRGTSARRQSDRIETLFCPE